MRGLIYCQIVCACVHNKAVHQGHELTSMAAFISEMGHVTDIDAGPILFRVI